MKQHLPGLDGLRAIAVAAVLLFHAFPAALPGGYIGVDVFFVLSGYIITKTYFEALRTGSVTLTTFYLKRIRRLAPAYLLVLAVTTVAAYCLINPLHLKNFSASLAAQPFYLQNIVFWSQGDYFDGPLTKPLLHTWSLAVEEQFYVLYGLMILAIRRKPGWPTSRLMWVLALCALGSFAAHAIVAGVSPKTSFFWLPTRGWGLAIGVLTGLRRREVSGWMATGLKWGGLCAILSAIGLFSESTGSQAMQAAIACMGTAAVIAAVTASRGPDRLLDQPLLTYTGRISYSLYLWHWPIISIATIYLDHPLAAMQAAAALGLAGVCAALSYHYVELPVRSALRAIPNARLLQAVVVSTVVTTGAALVFLQTDGAVYRYPPDLAVLYRSEQTRSPYRCPVIDRVVHPLSEMCQRNAVVSDRNILIIGDSHADQLDELIARLGAERNVGVFLATRNCNLHEFGTGSYCSKGVLAKILAEGRQRNIRNLIAISFFKKQFDGDKTLHDTLAAALRNDGGVAHLFIMQVVPNGAYFNPHAWIDVREKGREPPTSYSMEAYRADNGQLIGALRALEAVDRRITILDPSPYICGTAACQFASHGVPNYFDSHHLSPTGAQLLAPMFTEAIGLVAGENVIVNKHDAAHRVAAALPAMANQTSIQRKRP